MLYWHSFLRMPLFNCLYVSSSTQGSWAFWCRKSPATQLFVQQFVQVNTKGASKLYIIHPFRRESHVTVGFPAPCASKASKVITSSGVIFGCMGWKCITNCPFLHDRPWISPWIKSIFNELDSIIHMIRSELSGYCDVINNRLWRHQQNVNPASEARGRCEKIVVFYRHFIVVMSYKK